MFLQGLVYWTLLCKKTSYGCNPMMSTASLYKCFFTPLFLLGINFVLLLLLKITSVLFPHRSFSNLNALSVNYILLMILFLSNSNPTLSV